MDIDTDMPSEVEEPEELSPIMELPEEVRGVIFNKLPQSEVLKVRLVCKQWDKDVDNYYDFTIKQLDESSPTFPKILTLRIQSLEILKLSELSLFDSEGNCIFAHPALIHKLIIPKPNKEAPSKDPQRPEHEQANGDNEDALERKRISPENLLGLLDLTSAHLTHLAIDLSPPVCTYQLSSEAGYNFEKLKELELSLQPQNFFTADIGPNTNGMIQLLSNSVMPKLKSLKAEFNFSGYLRTAKINFIREMLLLVTRHGRDLETLWLELDNGPPLDQEMDILQPGELVELKKLDKLKDVYVKMKPTGLMATTGVWQELVCNQKHAVVVKMDTKFDGNVPLSQVPVSFLKNLVLNNEMTLVSLDIESFTLPADDPPFDMFFFRNCRALESLYLRRKKFVDRTVPNTPDILNFSCLPENLVKLSLFGFKIQSEKLLHAFGDESQFSKLEELSLSFCGEEGAMGFTGNGLDKIVSVSRPKLKEVYICRGINFEDLEDKGRLKEILETFGYDLRINRFLIRREAAEAPWTAFEV